MSTLRLLILLSFLPLTVLSQVQEYVDCAKAPRLKYNKTVPTVSPGIFTGKQRKIVMPRYPKTAQDFQVAGVVKVDILIDPRGCVHTANVVSGHLFLRSSARQAALASSFYPIVLGNKAVWVRTVISYNFSD